MPKQKTHKATSKRFKVTKSGKVKRHKSGKRHLLSSKSPKRRRSLRQAAICEPMDEKKVRRLLCLE
jgi:large subunit ribosomal protein L35